MAGMPAANLAAAHHLQASEGYFGAAKAAPAAAAKKPAAAAAPAKKGDKAAAAAKPDDPNAQYKTKELCLAGKHSCCGPSVPLGIKHWYHDGAHRGGGGWLCDKGQWQMDTKYKLDAPHPKPTKAVEKNPPGYASQKVCEKKVKHACCEPFATFGIKSWHGKGEHVIKNGSKFDCGDRAPKWTLDAKYKPPAGESHAAAMAAAPPPKPVNHKWAGKTVCVINGQNDRGCCGPDKTRGIKHYHGVGEHGPFGTKKYTCQEDLKWSGKGMSADKKAALKAPSKHHHAKAVPMMGMQGPGIDPGLRTH